MPGSPLKVFISYSHKDEALKDELKDQLSPLKRQNKIEIWHDRAIDAGEDWNAEILNALDSSDIILLLVTARFINSDFCFSKEMNRAMVRYEQKTARVIPIIMAPCYWNDTPFAKLQALPRDGKPVTEWNNRDSAYTEIVRGISNVVNKLLEPIKSQNDGWSTPPAAKSSDVSASAPDSSSSQTAVNPYQKRMELFSLLSSLPGPQFEQIVFTLRPPAGNVPPPPAPLGQRVAALLEWAESPIGCSLEALETVVNAVLQR